MIDLFDPRLPDAKLHPHFNAIRTSQAYSRVQPVIQGWASGVLERKGEAEKFIKEFQSTFDSSMWEMYLNRALVDLGCVVDYSKYAPDFFVTGPGKYEFNIEAVVSGRSKGEVRQGVSGEKNFKTRGALKLAGKVKDKLDIYRGTNGKKHPYSSMSHVRGKPFVIAIAPFDSGLSLAQNNELINMVLFGLAPPVLSGPDQGRQGRIASLSKPSGAPVEMGIFTNDAFKEISAVFFSTVGTFGKAVVESKIERLVRATRFRVIRREELPSNSAIWRPGESYFALAPLNYLKSVRWTNQREVFGPDYSIAHSRFHKETHLDGLQVYFNPYAEVPFNPDFFWPKEVALNYWDLDLGESIQEHPDGALVSRQVFDLSPDNLLHWLDRYGFPVK